MMVGMVLIALYVLASLVMILTLKDSWMKFKVLGALLELANQEYWYLLLEAGARVRLHHLHPQPRLRLLWKSYPPLLP